MISIFLSLDAQTGQPQMAFAVAFATAIAVRVVSILTEPGTVYWQWHGTVAGGLFFSVLGAFLWLGSAELTLRFFHLNAALAIFAVLSGVLLDADLARIAMPSAAKLRSLRWLNGMLLHWACLWICALEWMIFAASGDMLSLVFVAAFCLVVIPMSMSILATLALRRERWGVED